MSDGSSPTDDFRAEVDRLAEACLRNDITTAEVERLEALVRNDPAARTQYLNYVVQSACLARWADSAETSGADQAAPVMDIDTEYLQRLLSQKSRPEPMAARPAVRRAGPIFAGLRGMVQEFAGQPIAAAILVAVVIFGGILAWNFSKSPLQPRRATGPAAGSAAAGSAPAGRANQGPGNKGTADVRGRKAEPKISQGMARVSRLSNARWRDAAAGKLAEGAMLFVGQTIRLQQGLAELAFDSGAVVVLEGPADLTVGQEQGESRLNTCMLTEGKLVARVPTPAHGFTVQTPTMRIVDLGTEFGVQVRADGEASKSNAPQWKAQVPRFAATEVHVLRGEVQVAEIGPQFAQASSAAGKPKTQILKAGEGIVSQPDGAAPRAIEAEPTRFVRELPQERADAAQSPLSPGDVLAVGRKSLTLVKIDPQNGRQTALARGEHVKHGGAWICVGVDSQRRAVVGTDGPAPRGGYVLRIDLRDGSIRVLARGGLLADCRVTGLAIAPDDTIYATLDGLEDKVVKIDPKSGAVMQVALFGNNVWGIAVDTNGRDLFAVSDGTGTVARLSGKSISPWVFGAGTKGVRGVAVRPDGRIFISQSNDYACRIAEVDRAAHSVTEIVALPAQPNVVLGMMAVEADGRLIVGGAAPEGIVFRVDVERHTIARLTSGDQLSEFAGVAVVPGALASSTRGSAP